MKKKEMYGIWGGRFQIIHRGHEYVLQYTSKNYSKVCIGIVNPNPQVPPWNILEHEKFDPKKNPFTYFQRAYLWNILLKFHNIDAVIVPHWHPRKSLKLEYTFLPMPAKCREWIIPLLPYEEDKIEDLKKLGEKVNTLSMELQPDVKKIHSSNIRLLFDNKNNNFKADIPQKIQLKTIDFLNGKDLDENFIVIPILKDNLHPLLICAGIWLSINKNKKLIFAPVVNVKNEIEWWKYDSENDSYFTFYQKHEIINYVMKSINFGDYMVIPIIVMDKKCESIDAFLPNTNNRSWYFIKGINANSVFSEYLNCEVVEQYTDYYLISDEIYLSVFSSIFNMYFKRNFYDKEEVEEKIMSKNDFRDMKVSGDFIYNENNNSSGTYVATKPKPDELVINILNADDKDKLLDSIKIADSEFNGKTKEDIQSIVENTVKKCINSKEKKKSFIKMLKPCTFDISKSIVAGLLLQAVKDLIF